MRRFFTVFEFEFKSYLKNKSFMITTILISVLLGAIMFLPNFVDMSDMLGTSTKTESTKKDTDEEEKSKYGILDQKRYVKDSPFLETFYENAEFKSYKDEKALKKAVEQEEVEAGFVVEDDSHFRYLVWNNSMYNDGAEQFNQVMTFVHKQIYCQKHHLNFEEMTGSYDAPVQYKQEVLGKNASDNYWYSYVLVVASFMVIILYCVMIATSVASEKSNRAIEVLVTSIDSKFLLFGKVLSGALAAFLQVGIILGVTLLSYQANRDVWGSVLDPVLHIPSDVLIAFTFFGIGGFLFYACLYGALGALVSKTEDVNKSVGGLQMIVMIVYVVVLMQLDNTDGIIVKVCSYLPFSSYCAMFVRIALGNVAMWEIVVSFAILVVSTVFVGWLAAKIYRMGTLRYGNPISIRTALKNLKGE